MQNIRAREQKREHRARGLALKSGLKITPPIIVILDVVVVVFGVAVVVVFVVVVVVVKTNLQSQHFRLLSCITRHQTLVSFLNRLNSKFQSSLTI